jgi:hypothetical protein
MKRFFALILVGLLSFSSAWAELSNDAQRQTLERGRSLTQAFYEGKLQLLWDAFDDDVRDMYQKDFAAFTAFQGAELGKLGKESKLLEERAYQEGENVYYERIVNFSSSTERFQLLWQLEGDKVGLFVFKMLTAPSAPPEG